MKKVVLAIAALIVAAVVVWRVMEVLRTDEDRIGRLVDECVAAARARVPKDLLAHVDPESYSDGLHESRQQLAEVLNLLPFVYKAVSVEVLSGPDVAVAADGQTATATLRAKVLLGTDPQTPPTDPVVQTTRRTDGYLLHLRKKEGVWLITRVEKPPKP